MSRILISGLVLAGMAAASAISQDESRVSDVAMLRDEVVWFDVSYSEEDRDAALALTDALEARADTLSNAEFALAVAEIVALSGNGHTQVLAPPMASRFGSLPVRFLIADDGLFIADTADDLAALRGERVAAICGQDLAALRETWSRYTTGRQGYQDESLYFFIETPALLEAAGVCTGGVQLDLASSDDVLLDAREDVFPPAQGIWQFLAASRLLQLAEAGRIMGDPLYLQEPEAVFRLLPLPERDAAYLQFRSNIDFSRQTDLRELADGAIETLRAMDPATIIVDQRFNLGGDLNTTRALMQALPDIVGADGRVFVITSGRTFSAGISSVGYLKQAGGDRVTIVGAPVGDSLQFWAEGDPVRLPVSGLMILRATERHNYMTGCPEEDCHGSIRNHPIAVDSLEPDIRAAANYADLMAGGDPYLEAVFAMMDADPPSP